MPRLGKMQKELMKSAHSKAATVIYPFTKEGLNIPKGLRGKWSYAEPEKCTGCKICERVCPSGAIEMIECRPDDFKTKTGVRPICHFDRCILCAQCVESCPRNVLRLDEEYEMAFLSRSDMVIY
ncbi:MAG: 4Fe-4S dicluster domain-containing protein [Candidatus Thorarchaeota archaeon]|nr:4Fe-4S dicluster domain-containing protein [Candidatus Thorarchaeota archaeon]